jgi:hypothetical protein
MRTQGSGKGQLSRPLKARIWNRAKDEWYVEPEWCSIRLFEEEKFNGVVYDPACGLGRIVLGAIKTGHKAYGSDLVDRGWDNSCQDFFQHKHHHDNIVFNVPFNIARPFVTHALGLARNKVATVFPLARLNAAHWLKQTPLRHIWLMTPRPSMPPGSYIKAGKKPGGGKTDFCWLVFEQGYVGPREMLWLHREVT